MTLNDYYLAGNDVAGSPCLGNGTTITKYCNFSITGLGRISQNMVESVNWNNTLYTSVAVNVDAVYGYDKIATTTATG
ncbi:MAG: hypothetical protein MJZ46_08025, partial [Bacteroidales bacterium]|nr:hypothetical protein [Bacteroidales bacterium]